MVEIVETLALILTFSPGEKEQPGRASDFANDCTRIQLQLLSRTTNDSPSPWGDLSGLGNRERNSWKPKARRAERAGASESTPG